MVPIARRNLLADKVKLLMAIGGVTLAIVLILVVQSLYYGVRREADAFVRNLPGDVWIAQEGTTDLVFSNSHLPESAAENLCAVSGVQRIYGLSGRLLSPSVNGKFVRTYILSLDPMCGSGEIAGKHVIPPDGTIFIDRTFAGQTGLSEGDQLEFDGRSLTVSDIRHIGNVLVTQFAFVREDDYRDLFAVPGSVNFFLVTVDEGVPPESLLGPLGEQIERSVVYTTDEFANTSSAKSTGDFIPIIRVILVIAFIVGLAVLSLTIYSATIERSREYAVMKVIGASPIRLYRIVLSQSAFIAVLGFIAGVALAFVFNRFAEGFVPQFITHIRWRDVALVGGVTFVLTFIASYLPINRVARVEPASVFRA